MKHSVRIFTTAVLLGAALFAGTSHAQQSTMQFFRPTDKAGINIFETSKRDTVPYTGLHVRIGGAFAQDYQSLTHENASGFLPTNLKATPKPDSSNFNALQPLTGGFNLAQANMSLDAQLEDGIRANLTVYLSSRHHTEAWVKNGYLQVDKLSFLHSDVLDEIMKSLTFKVGALEVDYGDQHYRRTDGGNSMYNPFVENYIMDEFATEIGGELYFHPENLGLLAMVGVTSGMLNPTVVASNKIDSITKNPNSYNPAFHAKLGYDNQFSEDLRVRLTGSIYKESSTSSSTLFGGDRTGSRYFFAMENTVATTSAQFSSGRFNPGFSDEVTTFMINPFVKFMGFELFGTFESAEGRGITETTKRKATQVAADVLYRFGPTENFWVGARYNDLKATMLVSKDPKDSKSPIDGTQDININRITASAGWFLTPNVMMKLEYVTQAYKDFVPKDIRSGGKFSGVVVEAALGF
jgi:hypothetical protein